MMQSAHTATLVARTPIVLFFMARSPLKSPKAALRVRPPQGPNLNIYNYCELREFLDVAAPLIDIIFEVVAPQQRLPGPPRTAASRQKEEVMFRLRGRDWIILTAFIVAGAVGYVVYSIWTEEGLRRTEADMKSNLPLRVDQNTTLVDVKYERTHSIYWYVIDKPDQFDPQETARQVQIGVCANADNSSTMKKEGFSYEYHYRTKEGLALTDFKITTCE
jgi:hypothetical protein